MATEKSYKLIAASQKTIQVLLLLSEHKEPLSAGAIARRLNAPLGTVLCHLVTLEDQGLAAKVGDGWEVGLGAALIWARVKSREEFRKASAERSLDKLQ